MRYMLLFTILIASPFVYAECNNGSAYGVRGDARELMGAEGYDKDSGWGIGAVATGDVDGDGRIDKIIVAERHNVSKEQVMLLFRSEERDCFAMAVKYKSLIPGSHGGLIVEPLKLVRIEKGLIVIELLYQPLYHVLSAGADRDFISKMDSQYCISPMKNDGSAAWAPGMCMADVVYKIKYKGDCFRVIGVDVVSRTNATYHEDSGDVRSISVNLSTSKYVRKDKYSPDEWGKVVVESQCLKEDAKLFERYPIIQQ